MTFERPLWLLLVPLLAATLGLLAWQARRQRVAAAGAWSRGLGELARSLGRWTPLWFTLVGSLIGIGLAGPRWGTAGQSVESRALNVVLVVDVSRSMLAQDVAPNRLGRAVALMRRMVQDLAGDRFALIAFAGHPYLLSPLTLDQSAITLQLDALDPEMASVGGSALAASLDLARHLLTTSPQGGDRAIVVISDGESFEGGSALAGAGAALARSNIALVAIPVGGTRGTTIPDPDGRNHRDNAGQEVITRRHDELLQAATRAANGVFVPADAPDPVGDARRALEHLHRAVVTDRAAADLIPRAWVFALAAALILLGHTLTRRSAALVCIAMCMLALRASAQRPSSGSRLLLRGDTVRARSAFANEARRTASDSALYNSGTSALMAGDMAAAIDQLQRASNTVDPVLRQRALYNLGTAYLLRARRDSAARDTLLSSAAASLQEALLLAPGDRNAKFNYELARRLRPPPPPPHSSSAGNGNNKSQPQPQPSHDQSTGANRNAMTQAEADQVLSAMERSERETRQNQYQRNRRNEPPRGPDW